MKQRILFIVQLPPPVHGVTLMNQYTVDYPWWKRNYETKTLPLHFGQKLEDIGVITPGKVWRMIGFLFRLCYTLIKFRPSLVYFTITPSGKIFYRDALFTWFIKLFCPRIIFHLHKKGVEETAGRSRLNKWLYKKTFKGVKVICLSEKLTHDIRSIYEDTPFILPNGIEVVENVRAKRDNPTPQIIFLSNLIKLKGIEIFLQSLAELRRQGCDFNARIVGESFDYPMEEATAFCTREGIADVVQILGPKFNEAKFEELRQSDIFVLPSYNECVPLTILEAMQFGLSVVTTNVGGIPDVITHGANGLLVTPGNVKELTTKLKQLIDEKKIRVTEAARLLGYRNVNNFVSMFKKHYEDWKITA